MYEKIFYNIKTASDRGRLLASRDLLYIYNLLIEEYNLESVCHAIYFKKIKKKDSLAAYNFKKEWIVYDIDKVKALLDKDDIYYANLYMVKILLHEIEHAKQKKIFNEKNIILNNHLDIEKLLIDCSYHYLTFNGRKLIDLSGKELSYLSNLGITLDSSFSTNLYRKNVGLYTQAPHERICDIKPFYVMKNLLRKYDKDNKEMIDVFDRDLNLSLLRGYKERVNYYDHYSPSYEFLETLNFNGPLEKIKDYEAKYLNDKSLNMYRLIYGLPVERDYIIERIQKTKMLCKKNGCDSNGKRNI